MNIEETLSCSCQTAPWLETNPPSRRHHVFVKTSHKEVQLAEVGPRFEMKRMWEEPTSFVFNMLTDLFSL